MKYDEKKDTIINAIRNGALNKEAAELAGIAEPTFYEWMKKAEFSKSVKKARADFEKEKVQRLERALYTRAIGFEYEEVKSKMVANPNDPSQSIMVEQVVTTKRVAPDTTALIFALTNEAPEKWKNKQEVKNEHSGSIGGLNLTVSNDDIAELVRKLKDK